MRNSSALVIGIPLFIVGLIVAGVFVFRMMNTQMEQVAQIMPITAVPTLKGDVGKPNSGFSETTTTSAVNDLSAELNTISDDWGASDYSELEAEAAKL